MKTDDDRILQATRRAFLKGGAALGLAGMLPLLMSACADDDDPPAGPNGPRESRSLHFDLSASAIAEPRLRLPRSAHHNALLKAHTAESRQKHRALNPLLGAVADDKLTHYLEDVDVPAGALQIAGVWGVHPSRRTPVMAMHFIHVPTAALKTAVERRGGRLLSAKMAAYGVGADDLDDAPIESQIAFNSPPWDVATAMVFQHPQITNLQPDLGADIVERIQNLPCDPDDDTCTPYLGTLAFRIATMITAGGYPGTTPSGSWATLKAVVDQDDGSTVRDTNGNPIYSFQVDPGLSDPLAAVVKQILADINDDPTFAGTNWQPADGGPATQPTQTLMAGAVAGALADSAFTVQPGIAMGKRISGIRMDSITATDGRAVRLTVRNEFLRSAAVYIEYQDATGATLPVANQAGLDSDRAKFVSIIGPDAQIMGVPFQDKNAPATPIQFAMPAAASQAVVHFGGLGLGGSDAFSTEALPGSISTLVLNLGLPTIFLTFGIYTTYQKGITSAFEAALNDPNILQTILKAVVASLASGGLSKGIQTSIGTASIKPFLLGIASTVVQIFLKIAPSLGLLILLAAGASAVTEAIPFVGLALFVLSTAADVATIGETLIECLCCPALDKNVISLTMSSTVRISRDPRDFQFPASARKFHIDAYYDGGKTPRTYDGTVTQGQVDPIDAVLSGVPSGGKVVVHAFFYSDQGCLVGTAVSDPIGNLPATAALIPLTLTELALPLDATTTYQHSLKLQYAGGAHVWSQAPAPTVTRSSLCQGNDQSLCALGGLTVHTASGMAGYGFNAGGQGVGVCGGGSAASLYTLRNVFLGRNPDSGAKFSGCGTTQPMGIVYDPLGATVGGHNFFLQPGSDGFFYLRGVNLDASALDMNQTLTWGRFMNAFDSLTATSNGYVVAVNRVSHRMEILTLPSQAVDLSAAPDSVPFSALKGGKGSRAGLLDTPVAVTSFSGAILVLEQGNQRVQAFDHDGNNVNQFTDGSGQPTPLMPLKVESDVTYLDIAVEGQGYMYVLSYTGSGTAASDYRVDVYTPAGAFLARTGSVAAGALAVDLFRNLYTLNYETVAGAPAVEPSLSQWLPVSTLPCPTTLPSASTAARQAASCAAPTPDAA